jgi:hypothetical protein
MAVLALVFIASAPTDAGAAQRKRAKLTIAAPTPGHVTIAGARFVVKTQTPKRYPRRVGVGFPKRTKHSGSVRLLWATRSFRKKGSVTYDLMVVAVRKPGAAGARAAYDDPTLIDAFLNWGGQVITCGSCGGIHQGTLYKDNEYCDSCHGHMAIQKANQLYDADHASPGKFHTLTDLFAGPAGGNQIVFEGGAADDKVDPTIDSGHYDDGHSFGWKVVDNSDSLDKLLEHIADNIVAGQQDQLIPTLEVHSGVDLNGDGSTRDPRCDADTFQNFPMTITTPPPGQIAFYSFPTAIPNWLWYKRQYGAGGCNHDDKSFQANVEIRAADGGLLAWEYDWEPFPPNSEGVPADAHGGRYCPKTEQLPDGQMKTYEQCEIGIPTLGSQPPPEEGHLGSVWPRSSSGDQYYSIVFGVGYRRGNGGDTGSVDARIAWRPKP